MRVLAASTGGAGHFGPMTPFLRGCVEAGHELLVATPGSFRPDDLPHAPLPDTPPEELGAVYSSLAGLPREVASARVLREVFGRANVDATLPALESLVAEWRPDVVVRETAELASYVAATRAGVPHVQVAISRRPMEQSLVEALGDGFAEGYGVAPPPADTRTLSLVPPSMEVPGPPREHYRDAAMVACDKAPPDGLPPGDDPLVYVTFGSIAASIGMFPGVYRAVLDALAGVPVRVLMTVGGAADPAGLGPLPANAVAERWAPQAAVLRHARVAVGHGGFGTTFGALAAGVPAVVVPLFSGDQFDNAAAVAATGAGVALDGPDGVGEAVTRLLSDEEVRGAVRRVADEMAALPPAESWLGTDEFRARPSSDST